MKQKIIFLGLFALFCSRLCAQELIKAHNNISANNLNLQGIAVVGSGTAHPVSTPPGYSLYVGKGILAEKIKIANSDDGANWSDFVFDKDYVLMPLQDVEAFVQQQHHLPDVPTAAEVGRDGIDVARMDAKLLQKIEELTLYAIQQQKEIDELKRKIDKLAATK